MSVEENDSLESLMLQVQQGDQDAYAELLGQCERILAAMLRPQVGNHEDLNDLVQECLISIHKARHTYQPQRPFKPWMFAIANYRLKDHFRGSYRRKNLEQAFLSNLEQEKDDCDVTYWEGRSEQLKECIDQLPGKQAKLVLMTKIQGYTAKETATQMGMTESAVKVAVHRSLKGLTMQLKDQKNE